MYRAGEIKESLAFPKAIGEVKGWGLRKIRGWQRMLSRGKERGQGRNQYVLTVWNAFQLVSRRDKIKNSPFCELLLLSRNDQALKISLFTIYYYIAITLQIANFQPRATRPWTTNGRRSFSLVKSSRWFKSLRNFLILQCKSESITAVTIQNLYIFRTSSIVYNLKVNTWKYTDNFFRKNCKTR